MPTRTGETSMDDNNSRHNVTDQTFRLVVESSPTAIVLVDPQGIIALVNTQAEAMFGYARQELVGQSVDLLVPAQLRDSHRQQRAGYLANPQARPMGAGHDLYGRRKDGSEFPVEIGLSPVKTDKGLFVLGAIVDISERKRIERALAEREEFLQTIFDTEPECVLLLDRAGAVLTINRAGLQLLEVDSAENLEGVCVYPMIAEEHRAAFQALNERIFEGQSGTVQFDCIGRRGTRRALETHAVPLRDTLGGITAALSISRDITDRRRAEERARQAERLATIGQVVAGLAHESRNALQRGQASLEMLELEVADNANATELVARVQRAQDHLQQLFEEVRNYAAPIKLDRMEATLSEIWREAWALLTSQRAGRQTTLKEVDEGVDLSCQVDRFRLVQVFRNLLENSLAACVDPAEITIACRVLGSNNDGPIELTLRDNGPGLDPDSLKRVFEPFFTTKTKGTGLGMSIAQRIVEAHGGTIAVRGGDGPGATFVVTLPRG